MSFFGFYWNIFAAVYEGNEFNYKMFWLQNFPIFALNYLTFKIFIHRATSCCNMYISVFEKWKIEHKFTNHTIATEAEVWNCLTAVSFLNFP